MAENAELQAKIAALEDRISRHKAADTDYGASHAGYHNQNTTYSRPSYHSWAPQRYNPYGSVRGGAYGVRSLPQYRNRKLVVNNSGNNENVTGVASTPTATAPGTPSDLSGTTWVKKHDRHKQLINNSVFEREQLQRTQAMEETRKQRLREKEEEEKLQFHNHLRSLGHGQNSASFVTKTEALTHHVFVKNLKFIVTDGGSKLIKAPDQMHLTQKTPKRVYIGGVKFLRSKHGNLYRAGFIKTKRATDVRKIAKPCLQFSTTGICPKGPLCGYQHNPDKVAICRDFLQTGKCPADDNCDLSHVPTAERVPACLHFLRGNCTNEQCRYAHVRTNPAAPVCRAFAVLGYCSKGAACEERHVSECPDFTNKGICRNEKCRLPHIHRAGQLRKAAALESVDTEDGQSSDISSDDEMAGYDSDDVDSDDLEEDLTMSDAERTGLSQQDDFVRL